MKPQNIRQITQKLFTFCLKIALIILLDEISFQAQTVSVLRVKVQESSTATATATRAEALNNQGIDAAQAGKIAEAAKLFQQIKFRRKQ